MLSVDSITVRFVGTTQPVLDDFSLSVADGETVALLGPSGCGKTTVLRSIAGLHPIERGTISLGGENVTDVATHRRGLGLMFQEHALFPHLRVAGNVEFGLRMQGLAPEARRARVHEVLDLVGLTGHADRPVDALSGGERQRVALARAIAPAPRLLMLDEPLGSLDRALRDRLVSELQAIFAELDLSVLYVTHDQSEAMALADRMIVMNAGRAVQQGPPVEIWTRPADAFVARFLGLTNVIGVEVRNGIATTPWGLTIPIAGREGRTDIVIRSDAIGVRPAVPPGGGIPATVIGHTFAGDRIRLRLRIDARDTARSPGTAEMVELEATVDRQAPIVDAGSSVAILIHPDGVIRLDR